MTEDERCAEHRRFERIDDAFRRGDLAGLRAAVEDPDRIPNGPLPDTVGSCLVYAVYHSPLAFIRTLLEIGADPDAPVDDGFPPLIAALSTAQEAPGATPRADVEEVVRLLLRFGADPNGRGINDYTPLHMAAAVGRPFAAQLLLEAGADPDLRTRIDDHETALELARTAGAHEVAAVLERRGAPLGDRLRPGLVLLADFAGTGAIVRRQQAYGIRLRLWLRDGSPVRWHQPFGPVGRARLEDEGELLVTETLISRSALANGLFYGMDGMRVGGTRRLEIAPHLGYGARGVPGGIPANATLRAEVTVLQTIAAPPGAAPD